MKSAAPTNPKTFLGRDNWMRALNASGLPRGARCLGFAIALHLNVKAGRCDPGHKILAKDAGISERSVDRFAALLEAAGWLAVKRGGRGHHNSYVLVRPASNLADQESDDPPVSAEMIRQNGPHDPPHVGGQKAKRKVSGVPKGTPRDRERDVELALADDPGGGGRLGAAPQDLEEDQDTGQEDSRAVLGAPNTPDTKGMDAIHTPAAARTSARGAKGVDQSYTPAAAAPDADVCQTYTTPARERLNGPRCRPANRLPSQAVSFAKLLAIYDRGFLDDPEPAWRAWVRAIASGADHDEIMAGARLWVAAADAPRFLKPLAVWLDREGWLKEPPARRKSCAPRRRRMDACEEIEAAFAGGLQ
jgi:hypothetical protein